jgi:hypothetical protein
MPTDNYNQVSRMGVFGGGRIERDPNCKRSAFSVGLDRNRTPVILDNAFAERQADARAVVLCV